MNDTPFPKTFVLPPTKAEEYVICQRRGHDISGHHVRQLYVRCRFCDTKLMVERVMGTPKITEVGGTRPAIFDMIDNAFIYLKKTDPNFANRKETMNTTESWELVLSMMANTMKYRHGRVQELHQAIAKFKEATDYHSKVDVEKLTAVLEANQDRMRELVEATGKVANELELVSDTVKQHLDTILELHPDGAKVELP